MYKEWCNYLEDDFFRRVYRPSEILAKLRRIIPPTTQTKFRPALYLPQVAKLHYRYYGIHERLRKGQAIHFFSEANCESSISETIDPIESSQPLLALLPRPQEPDESLAELCKCLPDTGRVSASISFLLEEIAKTKASPPSVPKPPVASACFRKKLNLKRELVDNEYGASDDGPSKASRRTVSQRKKSLYVEDMSYSSRIKRSSCEVSRVKRVSEVVKASKAVAFPYRPSTRLVLTRSISATPGRNFHRTTPTEPKPPSRTPVLKVAIRRTFDDTSPHIAKKTEYRRRLNSVQKSGELRHLIASPMLLPRRASSPLNHKQDTRATKEPKKSFQPLRPGSSLLKVTRSFATPIFTKQNSMPFEMRSGSLVKSSVCEERLDAARQRMREAFRSARNRLNSNSMKPERFQPKYYGLNSFQTNQYDIILKKH